MPRNLALVPWTYFSDPEDADAMHRETMSLFASELPGPDGSQRSEANILWRAERGGVLVSASVPFQELPSGATSIEEDNVPTTGEYVAFALTADVTIRSRSKAYRAPVDAWLEKRIGSALRDVAVHWVNSKTVTRRRAPLEQVSVVGAATVADPGDLEELLTRGVGRSKSFGCGLLTVRPL